MRQSLDLTTGTLLSTIRALMCAPTGSHGRLLLTPAPADLSRFRQVFGPRCGSTTSSPAWSSRPATWTAPTVTADPGLRSYARQLLQSLPARRPTTVADEVGSLVGVPAAAGQLLDGPRQPRPGPAAAHPAPAIWPRRVTASRRSCRTTRARLAGRTIWPPAVLADRDLRVCSASPRPAPSPRGSASTSAPTPPSGAPRPAPGPHRRHGVAVEAGQGG